MRPTVVQVDYATPPPARRWFAAVMGYRSLPLLAAIVVCAALYTFSAVRYDHFVDAQTALSFIGPGIAYVGVTAVGMTFVILAGGIDLSVGAVIACATVLVAVAVEWWHVPPALAMAGVVLAGAAFGAGQGCLIHFFDVPPFLITLAGLFLARGLALVMTAHPQPVPVLITHPLFTRVLPQVRLILGHDGRGTPVWLSLPGMVFLAVLITGAAVAKFTRFGRTVYAVGGNEQSAMLMGLPVGRTKVAAYAVSGLCAAIAGVMFTIDTGNGSATVAVGQELDAIAAVVVGGTALTGGVGSVLGTGVGFLTFAVLSTTLLFAGPAPAWNRVDVGALLLAFLLLQKLVLRRGRA
jgi:ribose/xylose/arabinose/galactoside ABC-type transport system permease subunit